jgi:uncharacterized OB-fold protein
MNTINESPLAAWRRYLSKGQVAYQVSMQDGAPIFFPRVIAPHSGAANLEWRISKGLGTVYSTTTVYRKNEAPLNIALIDLDEGYRLMSRVENINAEAVTIGLRVKSVVREADSEAPYPVFEPVTADKSRQERSNGA